VCDLRPLFPWLRHERNVWSVRRARARVTQVGFDVTLRFQTVESGIDSADGYLTANPRFNFLSNSDPIGPIAKAQKRQDDNVLEFTKIISIRH
jgi:hypothetical protein